VIRDVSRENLDDKCYPAGIYASVETNKDFGFFLSAFGLIFYPFPNVVAAW
jgi:hypothetical protein